MKNISEYQKCKFIRQIILNRSAEVMNYHWSDEFCTKEIRDIDIPGIKSVDITKLTKRQMDDLGFGKWSKEDRMRLIPLWLFKWLPETIISKSISGDIKLKKSEMDTDNRFGYLAYGIYPAK